MMDEQTPFANRPLLSNSLIGLLAGTGFTLWTYFLLALTGMEWLVFIIAILLIPLNTVWVGSKSKKFIHMVPWLVGLTIGLVAGVYLGKSFFGGIDLSLLYFFYIIPLVFVLTAISYSAGIILVKSGKGDTLKKWL